MLEWPVSALFVAGLGACVLRVRRWQYFFPVAWLLVAISGGVLSAVFEAPQGHRTLENSVVTALIAGIFVGELWATFINTKAQRRKDYEGVEPVPARAPHPNAVAPSRSGRPSRALRLLPWAGAVVAVALLAWAAAANYDRYFNRQIVSVSAWNEMQGPNRVVADVLLSYGATHRVMVNPARNNSPAARYLAPNYEAEAWTGPNALPFGDDRDTVIVLDATEEADVSVIKTYYPRAEVQTTSYGGSQQPQLYKVFLPSSELAAVRGVRYAVYSGDGVREGTHPTMSLDAVAGAPPGGTFEMSSTLKVTTPATYTFSWEPPLDPSPSGAEPLAVLVDGATALEGDMLPLGSGLHTLTVRGATASAGPGKQLAWRSDREQRAPIPETALFDPRQIAPVGLTAYVRQGEGFDGPVVTSRIDPILSAYFHTTPIPRPYTTEWVGKLYAPVAGMYVLHTEQISTSRLLVDGHEVVNNSAINTLMSGQIELTAGLHDIRLLYQDLADYSHMYLSWTPPTKDGRYTIPARFLLPDMEQYPAVPSTGGWPTVDEADDTVWGLNAASRQPGTQAPSATKPALPAEQQPTSTAPAAQATPPTSAVPALPIRAAVVLGGESDPALNRPLAGAADEAGNLYVFTEDGKVHRYGRGGEPLGEWDVLNAEGKPVSEISAILAGDGRVTLLDAGTSTLIAYSPEGEEQGRAPLCQCFYPRGVSVAPDGNLWVADTGLGRVIEVTPDGTLVSTLGEKGSDPGQFVEPAAVSQAPDGTVYVADVGNARVQSFDAEGKPIAQWPTGASNARDGSRVLATPDGNVLVSQQESQAVVLYDRQGQELARWAYDPGTGALAPSVIAPAGKSGAGLDSYLVLFPFNATALVFAPTP